MSAAARKVLNLKGPKETASGPNLATLAELAATATAEGLPADTKPTGAFRVLIQW